MSESFVELVSSIRACRLCAPSLPLGPRPVLQVDPEARILIAGQAPGRRVHDSGIPFDDASGDRLRDWMGIARATFYDPKLIAIVPMGFCFPGSGKSGDLAPRSECAKAWRAQLIGHLRHIELTLVIGQYAHAWHLSEMQRNLTETVRAWHSYAPGIVPLPHPSPRNNIWLKRNPWFASSLLPHLKQMTRAALR